MARRPPMNLLEYAIQMEHDGAMYYASQALDHKGTELEKIFHILEKEEKSHLHVLEKLATSSESEFTWNELPDTRSNLFYDIDKFQNEIRVSPPQIEAYELGLEVEKKSVAHYSQMEKESKDPQAKMLFHFLIQQETRHVNLLEKLVKQVKRPEEWVESAEFGAREEY